MPILLIFMLTASCLRVNWPAPLLGGGLEVPAVFTATILTLSLTAAFTLRTWVVATLRQSPYRRAEVGRVYSRIRRRMFMMNLGLVAMSILVFGWGWFIQQVFSVEWVGEERLAPFAELAVPGPYFVILFSAWLLYYDAERALHLTSYGGMGGKPFWSRFGFFLHNLRQFALLVMLPVGLFVVQQTTAEFLPETVQQDWYRIGTFGIMLLFILFMPVAIRHLLGLRSLPEGPVRARLESLAKRLHFRYADFLLWPTHGGAANAMIVGLVPPVRFVVFTDRILDDLPPEELDAVFGHEVGHAKHGHIWFYAFFFGLSIITMAAALMGLGQRLDAEGVELPASLVGWVKVVPLVVVASYIFVVWGFLSRRCERQADVYGCRAVSCDSPDCRGHDETTVYPERARGLCATGIRTFVNALERVDLANGNLGHDDERRRSLGSVFKGLLKWMRAWQHSTMPRRVAFLLSLIGDPARERRFQWSVALLRWGLILALALALFALGESIGWDKLYQAM